MEDKNKRRSSTRRKGSKKNDLLIQELMEKLSTLEHDQWVQYSKSVYNQIRQSNSKEDILKKVADKWFSKWKPYNLLSESEKDKDRIWANRVLEIISSNEQSLRALLSYKIRPA